MTTATTTTAGLAPPRPIALLPHSTRAICICAKEGLGEPLRQRQKARALVDPHLKSGAGSDGGGRLRALRLHSAILIPPKGILRIAGARPLPFAAIVGLEGGAASIRNAVCKRNRA